MADEALRAKQHSDESRLREQQRAEEDDMLNTDVREEGTERERDHRAADARPVERAFESDELVGGDRRRCHYAVSAASAARARSGSSKRLAVPLRRGQNEVRDDTRGDVRIDESPLALHLPEFIGARKVRGGEPAHA